MLVGHEIQQQPDAGLSHVSCAFGSVLICRIATDSEAEGEWSSRWGLSKVDNEAHFLAEQEGGSAGPACSSIVCLVSGTGVSTEVRSLRRTGCPPVSFRTPSLALTLHRCALIASIGWNSQRFARSGHRSSAIWISIQGFPKTLNILPSK